MTAQPLVRRQLWQLAAGVAVLAAAVVAPGSFFGSTSGSACAQATHAVRYRATIDSVASDSLSVTASTGQQLALEFASDTVIVAVVPMKLEDIRTGAYIGAAAMPQPDGTQRALEVHVFPENMRGTAEGHGSFDLKPRSTMTNGTVGAVTGSVGRTFTVTYQDGAKTIVVPPDTPVVTFEPGSAALLVPGAHVIVTGIEASDGSLSATRILVGKNGLVPPM
jgi:Domain of unknown function (DUF5666)